VVASRGARYWMSRDDLRAAGGIGVAFLISAVLWGCGALLTFFLWDHPLLLALNAGGRPRGEVTSGLIGATPYASMPHVQDIVCGVSFGLDLWPGYEPKFMPVVGGLSQEGPSRMAAESPGRTRAVSLYSEPGA
jgi:hypothetical protein